MDRSVQVQAAFVYFTADDYGLLDADYERALLEGKALWVLKPQRRLTPWSGR